MCFNYLLRKVRQGKAKLEVREAVLSLERIAELGEILSSYTGKHGKTDQAHQYVIKLIGTKKSKSMAGFTDLENARIRSRREPACRYAVTRETFSLTLRFGKKEMLMTWDQREIQR